MSKFVLLGFLVIWLSTNIVNSEEDALKFAVESSDDAELDSFTDDIQEDSVQIPKSRKRRTLSSLAEDDEAEVDEFDDGEEDEFDDDEEDEFDDEEEDESDDEEEDDGEEGEVDALTEFLDRDS